MISRINTWLGNSSDSWRTLVFLDCFRETFIENIKVCLFERTFKQRYKQLCKQCFLKSGFKEKKSVIGRCHTVQSPTNIFHRFHTRGCNTIVSPTKQFQLIQQSFFNDEKGETLLANLNENYICLCTFFSATTQSI